MNTFPIWSGTVASIALAAACSSTGIPEGGAIVERPEGADAATGGDSVRRDSGTAYDASTDASSAGDASLLQDATAIGDANVTVVPDAGSVAMVSRYGRKWIRYATVKKSQDTRGALLEVADMATFRRTGTIPEGAISLLEIGDLTLEKVGFLAYRVRVGGVWKAGRVYPADYANPTFAGAVDSGCEGCHVKAASGTLFTMPSLMRFATTHRAETFSCALPNFDPCLPAVYATGG